MHHSRWGGRSLEVLLLFLLIAFSIGVFVFVFMGGLLLILPHATTMTGGKSVFLLNLLAIALLAPIWKAFLRFYKYDPETLKPERQGKEDDSDSD